MVRTIYTKSHKALIAFIVAERKKRGMTQARLGKLLKQDQNWVWRLENGHRRVDVFELIQIAKLLKFDPVKALIAAMKADNSVR
jgi:transcriptional regulator with XRE-family HTH domain